MVQGKSKEVIGVKGSQVGSSGVKGIQGESMGIKGSQGNLIVQDILEEFSLWRCKAKDDLLPIINKLPLDLPGTISAVALFKYHHPSFFVSMFLITNSSSLFLKFHDCFTDDGGDQKH